MRFCRTTIFLYLFVSLFNSDLLNAQCMYENWSEEVRQTDSLIHQLLDKDLDSAQIYCDSLKFMGKKYSQQSVTATAISKQGLIHYLKGEKTRGLRILDSARVLRRKIDDVPGIIRSTIDLGIINAMEGDIYNLDSSFILADSCYNLAIESYSRAIDMSRKNGCLLLEAKAQNNTGLAYKGMAMGDEALEHFESARALYVKLNRDGAAMAMMVAIASIWQDFGELDTAETIYDQALSYFVEHNNSAMQLVIRINLAELFKARNKSDQALYHLRCADSLSIQIGDLNKQSKVQENFYATYMELGDSSSALKHYLKYSSLKAEIHNLESTAKLNDINVKYESEKKDKALISARLENFEKERATNEIILISGILLVVALLVIAILFWRQRVHKLVAKRNKLVYDQEIQDLLSQQELKSFETAIKTREAERKRVAQDLHDRLGSTLTAARMFLESNNGEVEKITGLVDRAIVETREIAHDMMSGILDKFGLEAALMDLKDSIDSIEGVVFDLSIDLQGYKRLNSELELNLYRITQELISNSLKHGKASRLRLKLFWQTDGLELIYEDNGIGFDITSVSMGMGISNIHNRTAICKGTAEISGNPGKGMAAKILVNSDR